MIDIGIAIVLVIVRVGRVLLLIDTIDFIISEINKSRLKWYVRELLKARYSEDDQASIAKAIRLNHGAFGLRLKGTIYRTYLDSETESRTDPQTPNLVVLHENGAIDLRELCGFKFTEGFWNRKRYKTLKKELVVSGGGGGEFDNPISEDELDEYLNSRGQSGPPFVVLPVRDGPLSRHISTAEEKGRELCLMLDFDEERSEVTDPSHIVHNEGQSTNVRILVDVLGRADKTVNPDGARDELCHPTGAVVFRYMNSLRGLASNLITSDCGLRGRDASGVTYIDQRPDAVWKYVLIHEFGHYFGLCHVDGLDRIMFSSKENSWWRWQAIPNLIAFKGEPYFTHGEAKDTWDYVVNNFSPECLGVSEQPVIQ